MTSPRTLTSAGAVYELADQRRVDALEREIERIVAAFGHDGALVTDESLISDLAAYDYELTNEVRANRVGHRRRVSRRVLDVAALARVAAQLGVPLAEGDLIVDVAWRLRQLGGG